jgi:vitamin B12 transporter
VVPLVASGPDFNERSGIYANYGASFRTPSFTELYYEDRSNVSNPNLLPEEAQNVEACWKFSNNKFSSEGLSIKKAPKT